MAHIVLANETVPASSSGNTVIYSETTLKKLISLADDGIARLIQPLYNANTAAQSIVTSDTYITNSNLAIPVPRAGAMFHAQPRRSPTRSTSHARESRSPLSWRRLRRHSISRLSPPVGPSLRKRRRPLSLSV